MMLSENYITGKSLSSESFRVDETQGFIDASKVVDVLNGQLAAYRIRQYAPSHVCQKIVENFLSSEAKTPRMGNGYDGVEAYILGASHIEKTTHEYLQEADASHAAVKSLFNDTINPIDAFRNTLLAETNHYTSIRAATHDGLSACDAKAVLWNSDGDFFLEPHDDFAQLKDPRQSDFEIQKSSRVMAVNFYAQVPENVGQLKIWNIEPDNASREKLGLTHSGYPYPAELLDSFLSTVIPVETGEICVINGNLIHAVLRGEAAKMANKNRVLITIFMASNNANELIWWT